MNGRTFVCDSCKYEWQRCRHTFRFGPASGTNQKLRCPYCDFLVLFPHTADRNSWQRWIDRESACLDALPRFAELAKKITETLPGSKYTPADVTIHALDCIGCDRPMLDCDDDTYRCPNCSDISTRITGEFADSISYIDPSDMRRWWLRVGS